MSVVIRSIHQFLVVVGTLGQRSFEIVALSLMVALRKLAVVLGQSSESLGSVLEL